jgi:catechol 2,3-dioxygenase-like lactoylglutathione lyase family enzyme
MRVHGRIADMDVSKGLFAITLIVEDLDAAKDFYGRAFAQEIAWEDGDSAIYKVGETMVNLLRSTAAPELIEPATIGSPEGVRAVYTIPVESVDAAAAELAAAGIELLNGPMDRPWGPRTLSFRDPAGNVWELSS